MHYHIIYIYADFIYSHSLGCWKKHYNSKYFSAAAEEAVEDTPEGEAAPAEDDGGDGGDGGE